MTDNEQDEYMVKDIFVDGKQQAVFLQNFRRDLDENVETFELSSIENFFPGRMLFFESLATSYDFLEIKVCKSIALSKSFSEGLKLNYEQLGYVFCEAVDGIHIIITVKNNCQEEEIIGHLCCRFAVDDKFFVVVLMAVFESDKIARRNSFGSMLLVLAEEVMNIFAKDCGFFVSFESNLDNKHQEKFKKFLQSLYFVEAEDPAKELQDYLKAPVTNKKNYYYGPSFPIILTTALFVWKIPQDNNNFPYYCKQVICHLLGDWEIRRNELSKKLSHTSSILQARFPNFENVVHHTLPSKIEVTKDGDTPSDEILQSLMPGLLLVDLGHRECHLKNPSSIGTEIDNNNEVQSPKKRKYDGKYESNLLAEYKNQEGHCLFFNVAYALFSDAKKYIIVRQLLCLIFNIISRLPEDHPCLGKWTTEENNETDHFKKYDWFFINSSTYTPMRLLQYFFLDNEENFDLMEIEHNDTPFDKKTYVRLEKRLTKLSEEIFDFKIDNLTNFVNIQRTGTCLQKKRIYRKIARCYLYDNFQGDAGDLNFIGTMFAVQFDVAKYFALGADRKENGQDMQDFMIQRASFGCSNYDPKTLFIEDKSINEHGQISFMLWFAKTDSGGHYLHFIDPHYDESDKETAVHLESVIGIDIKEEGSSETPTSKSIIVPGLIKELAKQRWATFSLVKKFKAGYIDAESDHNGCLPILKRIPKSNVAPLKVAKAKVTKVKVATLKVTNAEVTKVNEKISQQKRLNAAERQRKSRTNKQEIQAKKICVSDMVTYSNEAYAAKNNAFEDYFEIKQYLDNLKSLNDDTIDAFFPQLFETLFNEIDDSVLFNQTGQLLGVNIRWKNPKVGKDHYWTLGLRFFKLFSCEREKVPVVDWLIVKKSTITLAEKLTMGVFANRKFTKNEVIGLFYGQRIDSSQEISKYAFRSKYGTYDALRGFVGEKKIGYNMAMHIVVDPQDKTKVNAELSSDFLVRASREIHEGEEIFVIR